MSGDKFRVGDLWRTRDGTRTVRITAISMEDQKYPIMGDVVSGPGLRSDIRDWCADGSFIGSFEKRDSDLVTRVERGSPPSPRCPLRPARRNIDLG